MRDYTPADFLRIRDFLVATYGHFRRSYNWTLERWNFSASLGRTMHGISMESWASQVGIWEEKGEILGVVNAEGEDRGEAYFQLAHASLPETVLSGLFAFCEARLGKEEEGRRLIYLFLPSGDARLEAMAAERGFVRRPSQEPDAVLELGELPTVTVPITLPEGFAFVDGSGVSAREKGGAHAKAFGYAGEPPYPERAVLGFQRLMEMPDYRQDLDVHVRAPDGEIAAFATMWYDVVNRIGILEPVGTVPAYRRLGLGRACIHQAINRIAAEGAGRVHVGSDQVFYQRLGFVPREKYSIWHKAIEEAGA